MNTQILFVASCVLLLLGPFFPEVDGSPAAYIDDDQMALEDYSENDLERLLQLPAKRSSLIYLYRRACIRRGGNCDHRPTDCCYNSACRCNLWGANCRCQRKGLFQKWGK